MHCMLLASLNYCQFWPCGCFIHWKVSRLCVPVVAEALGAMFYGVVYTLSLSSSLSPPSFTLFSSSFLWDHRVTFSGCCSWSAMEKQYMWEISICCTRSLEILAFVTTAALYPDLSSTVHSLPLCSMYWLLLTTHPQTAAYTSHGSLVCLKMYNPAVLRCRGRGVQIASLCSLLRANAMQ